MRMIVTAALMCAATAACAKEVVVDQKEKEFSAKAVEVQRGDTVRFVNSDPFFHNVFSMSPARPFDLGWYPRGQSRSVRFDEPGVVEVECAIHPNMRMQVKVVEK